VPHRHPAQVHAGADPRRLQALERMQDDLGSPHEAGPAVRERAIRPSSALSSSLTTRTRRVMAGLRLRSA
jgi:hypothetical protein